MSTLPDDLADSLRELSEHEHAAATRDAYASDMDVFHEWLLEESQEPVMPVPVEAVVKFLIARFEIDSKATLRRRLSALSWEHESKSYTDEANPCLNPLVRKTLRRLIRKYVRAKRNEVDEAAPLSLSQIREMVMLCKADKLPARGARDRAIFLIGFSGGLRRSEIVALEWRDIKEVIEGLEITIRQSKTDQEARGAVIRCYRGQVPATCPVRALADWRHYVPEASGKIFLSISKGGKPLKPLHPSGVSINNFVRDRMKEMEVENWDDYSAHSLRKGFATVSIEQGASIAAVKEQGRWKSEEMLMRYVKSRDSWETAASKKLGL